MIAPGPEQWRKFADDLVDQFGAKLAATITGLGDEGARAMIGVALKAGAAPSSGGFDDFCVIVRAAILRITHPEPLTKLADDIGRAIALKAVEVAETIDAIDRSKS